MHRGKGGRVVKNTAVSFGGDWYELDYVSVYSQLILIMQHRKWKGQWLQKAELIWLGAIQYPEYHGAAFRAKHSASLFITRKMKNLTQTVPYLWHWEIIWSAPQSVFSFCPLQSWLIGWSGSWWLFVKFGRLHCVNEAIIKGQIFNKEAT